ncbi:MAG: LysR substrate-binding domain-containing protein [Acidobacteria bacterium]|nr:LysR substrate-binding domain-containing protein [Acidobacteriota bacterium]
MRLSGRVEGEIEISASTIPGEYILPRLIASFNTGFPGIRVEMRISDSMDVCERILNGSAEIGFAGAKIDSVGLEYRLFASDELVLVAPNNAQWRGVESIDLAGLARLPFIAREAGSGTQLRFEKAIGCSVNELNVVGRLGSTNAVKEAVKAGAGVSVLSLLSVNSDIAGGALKTVRIDNLKTIRREFYTAVNRRLTLSPVAEAFLEWVFESRAVNSISA